MEPTDTQMTFEQVLQRTRLEQCRNALKLVDKLWSSDQGTFTLNYEQEVRMESPLGKAWKAVRLALEITK